MFMLKKLAKLVRVAIVALAVPFVPGVGVAIYNTLFETQYDGVDKAGAEIWATFWKWASVYVPMHWDRFLWTSATIMAIWVLLDHGLTFIVRSFKRRFLVKRVGIRAFLPRSTDQERKESWDDCVDHLLDAGNDTILIAGANGWETFGKEDSPLHEVIRGFSKKVQILLVYPYSEAIELRANNVGVGADKYREDLVKTLSFCKNLKNSGHNIEVRFFDWPPVWKMIFSHNRLWLQHYGPSKHVNEMPAYSFGRDPNPSSLYHPFYTEFTRMWERSEPVNLSLSIKHMMAAMEQQPRPVACSSCDGRPAGKLSSATPHSEGTLKRVKPRKRPRPSSNNQII